MTLPSGSIDRTIEAGGCRELPPPLTSPTWVWRSCFMQRAKRRQSTVRAHRAGTSVAAPGGGEGEALSVRREPAPTLQPGGAPGSANPTWAWRSLPRPDECLAPERSCRVSRRAAGFLTGGCRVSRRGAASESSRETFEPRSILWLSSGRCLATRQSQAWVIGRARARALSSAMSRSTPRSQLKPLSRRRP
jgi:hypothetical protein